MNDENEIARWLQSWQRGTAGALPTPYQVPEHYFDALTGLLLERLDATDLSLTETLPSPYQVPASYFNQLEAAIQEKVNRPRQTVLPVRWVRWAAAAVLVGMLIFGAARLGQRHATPEGAPPVLSAKQIQGLDNQELTEFVEEPAEQLTQVVKLKKTIEVNQLFEGLSNQELQNFLNETAAGSSDVF